MYTCECVDVLGLKSVSLTLSLTHVLLAACTGSGFTTSPRTPGASASCDSRGPCPRRTRSGPPRCGRCGPERQWRGRWSRYDLRGVGYSTNVIKPAVVTVTQDAAACCFTRARPARPSHRAHRPSTPPAPASVRNSDDKVSDASLMSSPLDSIITTSYAHKSMQDTMGVIVLARHHHLSPHAYYSPVPGCPCTPPSRGAPSTARSPPPSPRLHGTTKQHR